jgi:protein TonB
VSAREHESSQTGTGDPVVYPEFPDLHPKEDVETSRKAPLFAVAAILFVAVAFYFGWSALRGGKAGQKPTEPPVNSTAPVFPSEPVAPAPAPVTTSAPAKSAPTPEAITKFVVPTEVAPNTVTKSQNSDNSSTPATTGRVPLQVQSGKRLDHEANASDAPDAGPAPSIGAVTSGGTGNELSTLVASTPATLPSAAPEAVRISQGVSQGLLLKRVQPVYPQQARQARIEGTVELLATIGKDGSIKDVKVVSGPPILGKVAVDAVRQWKYKPYYLNGDPVEVQTQIALNFRLPN